MYLMRRSVEIVNRGFSLCSVDASKLIYTLGTNRHGDCMLTTIHSAPICGGYGLIDYNVYNIKM